MAGFFSELILVFHFSLIFSITLYTTVLYFRIHNPHLPRLLIIMVPLFLFSFIYLIYYEGFLQVWEKRYATSEEVALYLLIASCIALASFIQGVSSLLISLAGTDSKRSRFIATLTKGLVAVYLLFSIYFLILFNRESWLRALESTLNEFFLYSTIIMLLPTVAATFYLVKLRKKGEAKSATYTILSYILIAFYPLAATIPTDLVWMQDSAFKLTLISHSLFSVTSFIYIHRSISHAHKHSVFAFDEKYLLAHEISLREGEIIKKLIEGASNKNIAEQLYISPNTVKTHIRNIYRKLEIKNRIELIRLLESDERETGSP